jgi:hypothetical protein
MRMSVVAKFKVLPRCLHVSTEENGHVPQSGFILLLSHYWGHAVA